ncbi:MAG: anaerobic sulfatase maturase [Rhodobacterales bacterium RIFCSPHIGHO2_02_FULL_62_130]|nr:MAG: anaerobic sulfatase maturase [Rhodobacterales bacterium RIFCSPHIGHO2_02_FULL_62_130]OHC59170.1 MAG: anaerobic sulfatase maturase [Rhodobacterales bacterium RIFCSPHIGHO2_12_FULL_62_75]
MPNSEAAQAVGRTKAFGVMAKPIGPICNLDCTYCYYLKKKTLFPQTRNYKMEEPLLERFVAQYIAAQQGRHIQFVWQGGEPTLLGVPFFEKVVDLQRRYCPPGKTISNAIQTNGTLVDQAWAQFFRQNDFLVGISIDGPRRMHDRHRLDRKGRPSFDAVMAGLGALQAAGVDYNVLTVVSRRNALHGKEIYYFLRSLGVKYMQFIPLVERLHKDGSVGGPPDIDAQVADVAVTAESVRPDGFGRFLCDVFDTWVKRDVGQISVQYFDLHIGLWAGMAASLCVHAPTCGTALVIEHNGDIYACDHFVYPEYRLGNLHDTDLTALAASPFLQTFGQDKLEGLSPGCHACRYLSLCFGGCPKDRFAQMKGRDVPQNYLCASYRHYFEHTAPAMQRMAQLIRQGRSPAEIMPPRNGGAEAGPQRHPAKPG